METLATLWFTAIRTGINYYFDTYLIKNVYASVVAVLGGVSLSVLTLLVMIDGYAIMAGKSSESATALALKWAKTIFLLTVATTAGTFNADIQEFIVAVRDQIGKLVAGGDVADWVGVDNIYDMILAKMGIVAAIASLTSLVTSGYGGDHEFSAMVTVIFASVGTTAPIMTALMTSLTMELSIKIATMLGPVCIFAGIFKRTEDWPFVWAKYMLGVMLTSAFMALMANIGMGLMAAAAVVLITGYTTGTSLIVLSTFSLLSGLVMSMLMISLPAVAVKVIGGVADGAAQNALGGGWEGRNDRVGGQRDRSLGIAERIRHRKPTDDTSARPD
jgi:type IV secretion system protein VirB6